MSIWEILEITPTTECSIIKKAYANKLKLHRPENDPEGYQILREAFDNAIKFAKNKNTVVNISGSLSEQRKSESETTNNFQKFNIFNNESDESAKYEKLTDDFFTRLKMIYADFFQRIEIQNWKEALNSDIMWYLSYKETISKKMLTFLMEHNHLPKHIWQFLNSNFNWDEQEKYLRSSYPDDFINYLFYQLGNNRCPRYCYFSKAYEINFDKYIDYRDQAFYALLSQDLQKAEHFISLAYEMYPHDPELLCMKGECELYWMNFKEAHDIFNNAVLISHDDMDIQLFQAQIYYKYNRIKKAMSICNYMLMKNPDYSESKFLLGLCYIKQKKLYKANKIFLENVKLNSSDCESRKQLNLISKELCKIYKKNKFDLRAMYNLNIIYSALGEYTRIKNMKLNFPHILLKLAVYIFSILFIMYALTYIILKLKNA